MWLSFRVDAQAERAANRPLQVANRALTRSYLSGQLLRGLFRAPLYAGPQEPLSARRTVRYLPAPFQKYAISVTAPPLMEVGEVRIFRD